MAKKLSKVTSIVSEDLVLKAALEKAGVQIQEEPTPDDLLKSFLKKLDKEVLAYERHVETSIEEVKWAYEIVHEYNNLCNLISTKDREIDIQIAATKQRIFEIAEEFRKAKVFDPDTEAKKDLLRHCHSMKENVLGPTIQKRENLYADYQRAYPIWQKDQELKRAYRERVAKEAGNG